MNPMNSSTDKYAVVPATPLENLVCTIFQASGSSGDEAARIAQYLVKANLTGHDSHGVVRVPRYVQMVRDGLMQADRTARLVTDTPVMAVLDGEFGFGQTIGPQAVQAGVSRCKTLGLSAVALRNTGHLGRIADWAEMAAGDGLVSVHFVNAAGSMLVAPFGSVERRFSTAPFCVGVPRANAAPLILDFATSLVAEGKVMVASQGGKAIPGDALIGPDGQTSDDTRLLYGDFPTTGKRDIRTGTGAIRAFGEHKGSGLALMCELLGGALTGNGCASPDKCFSNGMFSLYINPARIDTGDFFSQEMNRYIAFVKAAKPARAGDETLLPGEPEARARARRLANGISLPNETWGLIKQTAQSLGIAPPPF